jgi:hypothetical protein
MALTRQQRDEIHRDYMRRRSATREPINKTKADLQTDIDALDTALDALAKPVGAADGEFEDMLDLITAKRREVKRGG